MENQDKKIFHHASYSTGGALSLDIDFGENEYSISEKEMIMSDMLFETAQTMLDQGSMSIQTENGAYRDDLNTRQHWRSLIEMKKIPYISSDNKATIVIQTEYYLQEMENAISYADKVQDIRKQISIRGTGEQDHRKPLACPKCGDENFQYSYNNGYSTNGICHASGCNFHLYTQVRD